MPDTSSQSPRRPGRPLVLSPDARRQAILAAAETVFSAKGYAAAAVSDIARQAGMSKKTVYALFPNKRALFETLAFDREAFDTVLEPPNTVPTAEALRASLKNTVLFALSPRQVLATRLLIAAGDSEQGLAASFHSNVIARAQKRHTLLLATLAQEQGGDPQDAERMAKQLFGLAIGDLHILVLVGVELPSIEDSVERQVDNAMSLLPAFLARMGARKA